VECLETFFNTWGSFTFLLNFFPLLSRYSLMSERVQHDEQCSSLHDRWRFHYDERCSSLHAEVLKYVIKDSSAVWLHILCFVCVSCAVQNVTLVTFCTMHDTWTKQGLDRICSHTAELSLKTYFN